MAIFAVRHPEADIPENICYGHSDPEPGSGWQERIQLFAGMLGRENNKIDVIISSPLRRCKIAAEYLAGLLNVRLIIDDRLMEINFGEWEGRSYTELWEKEERYRIWMNDWKTAACPGGESLPMLTDRLRGFLRSPSAPYSPHENGVLLFTHAGVIRILYHLLKGMDMDEIFRQPVDHLALYRLR
ncbi:MAG: histidine phosphatase family protein [Salinispira sp.]